jgi:hypothetical protein
MKLADWTGDHVIPSVLLDIMYPLEPTTAPPKSIRGVVGTTNAIFCVTGAFGRTLFTAIALQVVRRAFAVIIGFQLIPSKLFTNEFGPVPPAIHKLPVQITDVQDTKRLGSLSAIIHVNPPSEL